MKLIAKALIEAQKEMGNAKKDSTNPFFKSKYADLNAIREATIPILNSHNIAVLQPMVVLEGKNYIETLLLHESGETIKGYTEIVYSKQNDAQSQGSGITYARRYGLQSLTNIGADDDDGNIASKSPTKKKLDADGYAYLMSDKATNEERLKALNSRDMTNEQIETLNLILDGKK